MQTRQSHWPHKQGLRHARRKTRDTNVTCMHATKARALVLHKSRPDEVDQGEHDHDPSRYSYTVQQMCVSGFVSYSGCDVPSSRALSLWERLGSKTTSTAPMPAASKSSA